MLALGISTAPVITFNIAKPLETIRANASYSPAGLGWKLAVFRDSLDASALFGYLTPEPLHGAGSLSALVLGYASQHNLIPWALAGCLFTVPVLWRTRSRMPLLFGFTFLISTWLMMALSGGGGSAHHAVLLWPLPHFLIAISLAEAGSRLRRYRTLVMCLILPLLVGSNFLVLAQYEKQMRSQGLCTPWTDAIYPLADLLEQTASQGHFVVMDWGILNSVSLLKQGRIPMSLAPDVLSKPHMQGADDELVGRMLQRRDNIYIAHTPGNEFLVVENDRFRNIARRIGFHKESLRGVLDSKGHTIFEVYRMRTGGH